MSKRQYAKSRRQQWTKLAARRVAKQVDAKLKEKKP